MRKVGILGGSFNPIHYGHLRIAREALAHLELERVIFVPAGDPPHKRPTALASACHRLRMVELAIKDEPGFEVSDIEVHRRGKSYTIDTIRQLQDRLGSYTELYFIIGADTIRELPTWMEIANLAQLCQFVVVARPGFDRSSFALLEGVLCDRGLRKMKQHYLDMLPCHISASDIRQRLASSRSVQGQVPPVVEDYIKQNGLYG